MKILFYGCGQMGGAVLEGLLEKKIYEPKDVSVFEKDQGRLDELVARGMKSFDPSKDKIGEDVVLMISVKPQIFNMISSEIKALLNADTIIVSIMAGVSIGGLKQHLGDDQIYIRTMPNLPLAYGEGATALAAEGVSQEAINKVSEIFGSVGSTVQVREDQMDAVTGVSGSGPAWVFEFVEAWIRGGVFEGLTRAESTALVVQTMKGSMKMLEESGESPANLTAKVCSPGGTTIAGVRALQGKAFHDAVACAVSASSNRSKELK